MSVTSVFDDNSSAVAVAIHVPVQSLQFSVFVQVLKHDALHQSVQPMPHSTKHAMSQLLHPDSFIIVFLLSICNHFFLSELSQITNHMIECRKRIFENGHKFVMFINLGMLVYIFDAHLKKNICQNFRFWIIKLTHIHICKY